MKIVKAPYFAEPTLLKCVSQYLTHNDPDGTDINIAQYLTDNFPQFRRKNLQKFKVSVGKATNYLRYEMEKSSNKKKAPKKPQAPEKIKSVPLMNSNSLLKNLYKSKSNTLDKANESLMKMTINEEEANKITIQLPQKKIHNDMKVKTNPFKRQKKDTPEEEMESHKRFKHSFISETPQMTIAEMTGVEELLTDFCAAGTSLLYPACGYNAVKSLLLTGPSGSGKTAFAHSIASRAKANIVKVVPSKLLENTAVDSEMIVKAAFSFAKSCSPCVLLFVDLGHLRTKDGTSSKDKVNTQISCCLEELASKKHQVLVVGEVCDPEKLDTTLRYSFKRELFMPNLDKENRMQILKATSSIYQTTVDFETVSERTPGCTAGDLKRIVGEASRSSTVSKDDCPVISSEESSQTYIDHWHKICSQASITPPDAEEILQEDFMKAIKVIKPALKREGFACIPETKWSQVGGMEDIKREVQEKSFFPIKYPEAYKEGGESSNTAILLWGPPGCGKTLLAKAVANEAEINFMSVSSPDLLNMYQGETEKAIREVFRRAAKVAPTIIFFDEIDSICPRRKGADSGNKTSIVTTLLLEMDSIDNTKGVCVLAATNRPDVLDHAILRPGRFGTRLYVGLPDLKQRVSIMEASVVNMKSKLAADVDLTAIAAVTEHFSGADCACLCESAARLAAAELTSVSAALGKKCIDSIPDELICQRHFTAAKELKRPSVSAEDRRKYQKFSEQMASLSKPQVAGSL